MAENNNFGFGKFVPGFDFLQSVAKGASQAMPQMPQLSNWIAPTLSVEELDKRIGELKAVQFWLDQNAKALAATIQALEVQKMTLATLKGMNLSMGEVANAFKLKPADMPLEAAPSPAPAPAEKAKAATRKHAPAPASAKAKGAAGATAAGMVDPLQWWGALTQQFQQIASTAMKDAAAQAPMATAVSAAKGAKTTASAAPAGTARATKSRPARKSSRARSAKKQGGRA